MSGRAWAWSKKRRKKSVVRSPLYAPRKLLSVYTHTHTQARFTHHTRFYHNHADGRVNSGRKGTTQEGLILEVTPRRETRRGFRDGFTNKWTGCSKFNRPLEILWFCATSRGSQLLISLHCKGSNKCFLSYRRHWAWLCVCLAVLARLGVTFDHCSWTLYALMRSLTWGEKKNSELSTKLRHCNNNNLTF